LGSGAEVRACRAKEIAASYAKLDQLSVTKAKTAKLATPEQRPNLIKAHEDAQKAWKQYVETHCDTLQITAGGPIAAEATYICKLDHILARMNELNRE